MQPDHFDHCSHRGLGIAQPEHAPVRAQPPGESRQVEHERRVPERELGEIDHDVSARVDGPGKCAPTKPLGRPVLVPSTTQYRGGVIELDDPGNLHNRADPGKAEARFSSALA
jgi:hypothetical protein